MGCFNRLSVLVAFVLQVHGQGPVVVTNYGLLEGEYRTNRLGQEYEAYQGIPFAAPPVGALRWEKPQPPSPWEGVRNATVVGALCTQFSVNYTGTSEDCLFLNVYVPGRDRVNENLAVMVWVHGGGFFSGSGNGYPGYDLALHGDVIVVTFNYRLGTLGFLSTEDEAAPGNYGLWDTQMALQWVQDNIAAFGGDASRVTVFGQSAGGAATSHLMISPATEGLFHRGIALSGQSSGPFGLAFEGKIKESTRILANFVGCRRLNDSFELVECLRGVPAEELDFWGFMLVIVRQQQLPNFIPLVDGDFIPQRPEDSWAEGAADDRDYMLGRLQHDGHFTVTSNLYGYPEDLFNWAANETTMNAWVTLQFAHYPEGEGAAQAVIVRYPGLLANTTEERTLEATQQNTDFWFSTYAHIEAIRHSRNSSGRTFMYNYRYRQSFVQYPSEWVTGSHSDDLYTVFGYDFNKDVRERLEADFNDDDFLVSNIEMTYFTNFANTGDPNLGQTVSVEWPEFDHDSGSYLEISDRPMVLNETEEMRDTYHWWHHDFADIAYPPSNDTTSLDQTTQVAEEHFTEEDMLVLVEAAREILLTQSSWYHTEVPDSLDVFDTLVDEYLERRKERLLGDR